MAVLVMCYDPRCSIFMSKSVSHFSLELFMLILILLAPGCIQMYASCIYGSALS